MPNRNYSILGPEIKPNISWQLKSKYRMTLEYRFLDLEDQLEPSSSARHHQMAVKCRYIPKLGSNINAELRWANINFNGDTNQPVAYALLEALQPGQNFNWSINLQHRLRNGLKVNLNYDGRKSENQTLRHTGRVQLVALF